MSAIPDVHADGDVDHDGLAVISDEEIVSTSSHLDARADITDEEIVSSTSLLKTTHTEPSQQLGGGGRTTHTELSASADGGGPLVVGIPSATAIAGKPCAKVSYLHAVLADGFLADVISDEEIVSSTSFPKTTHTEPSKQLSGGGREAALPCAKVSFIHAVLADGILDTAFSEPELEIDTRPTPLRASTKPEQRGALCPSSAGLEAGDDHMPEQRAALCRSSAGLELIEPALEPEPGTSFVAHGGAVHFYIGEPPSAPFTSKTSWADLVDSDSDDQTRIAGADASLDQHYTQGSDWGTTPASSEAATLADCPRSKPLWADVLDSDSDESSEPEDSAAVVATDAPT